MAEDGAPQSHRTRVRGQCWKQGQGVASPLPDLTPTLYFFHFFNYFFVVVFTTLYKCVLFMKIQSLCDTK